MAFKPTAQAHQSIYDLCAYFLTLASLIICAFFLHKIVPVDVPVAGSIKALFIRPDQLLPETHERILFVALIALLLPLNFIAIKLVKLLNATSSNLIDSNNILQKMVVLAIPVLLMLVISWDELLLLVAGEIKTYWLPACLTFMLAVVVFLSALTLRPILSQPQSVRTKWVTPILAAIMLYFTRLNFRFKFWQNSGKKRKPLSV